MSPDEKEPNPLTPFPVKEGGTENGGTSASFREKGNKKKQFGLNTMGGQESGLGASKGSTDFRVSAIER